MNTNIQIGKASFDRNSGGNGGGGVSWFYIEDNKPNVYRVLPPLKSLAASGRIAKYYKVHRGIRGTDKRQKPFICPEESDYKTRVITQHCPLCDHVRELEQNLEKARAAGASKEQLAEMRKNVIFPLQSEGKYYMNVVNQEGKMGVLSVGSKMFASFTALAKEMEAKGLDVTGMQGVYLNFKKSTAFKGDKNAVLSVEPYLAASSDGSFRYVTHELTQDVINRLEKETADLGNLFKVITVEQVATLLSYEGEARAKLMDTYFDSPEKESTETMATVPGTNASLVSNVTAAPTGGFQVNTPTLPPQAPTAPNNNIGAFSGNLNLGQTTASMATAGLVKPMGQLSDDEFLSMMTKK